MNNLAVTQTKLKKYAEAEKMYEEALTLYEDLFLKKPPLRNGE